MLSIEKINFPITFKNFANGKNITYHSEHGNGVWGDGWKSSLSLKYFINLHNKHNQSNSNVLRYYYEMAEPRREQDDQVDALQYLLSRGCELFIGDVKINNELIDDPVKTETESVCNIEDMPVGATLLAIQNDDEFEAITFTAKRVEIYDDVITLLSGYAGGSMQKRTQTYAAELNIKRGTLVKYSTNC
ncbi:hypothetical protein ACMZID_004355 [Salmonella enterica subsp. enterica serovar Brandenburg]